MATTPETELTPEGLRLVAGTTWPSSAREYPDLTATATEGGGQGDTVEGWVQWGTGSAWSEPVAVTATIDQTEALVTRYPVGFAKGTVGSTVPVRMSWTASDPESGSGAFHVDWNCGLGPDQFLGWLPATATSHTRAIHIGNGCTQYYAAADNGAGHQGYSPDQSPFTVRTAQGGSSALTYSGSWSTQSSSRFLGGSTRYVESAGASVTYRFTGRAVAFVTTLGPTRGRAEIWVDGVRVTTRDFKASSTKYRQLVWSMAWPTSGTHTVRVKVLGTAGRPRVDVDAFVKL